MSVTKVSDNMKVANLAGGHPSGRLYNRCLAMYTIEATASHLALGARRPRDRILGIFSLYISWLQCVKLHPFTRCLGHPPPARDHLTCRPPPCGRLHR